MLRTSPPACRESRSKPSQSGRPASRAPSGFETSVVRAPRSCSHATANAHGYFLDAFVVALDAYIAGGDDTDYLFGGSGDDIIEGGEGVDVVTGGDDTDYLFGGSGADTIEGGAGADLVIGGTGEDT